MRGTAQIFRAKGKRQDIFGRIKYQPAPLIALQDDLYGRSLRNFCFVQYLPAGTAGAYQLSLRTGRDGNGRDTYPGSDGRSRGKRCPFRTKAHAVRRILLVGIAYQTTILQTDRRPNPKMRIRGIR